MLKAVTGILILCVTLGGSAIAAPLAGVNVDFYPNENALNSESASSAGSDDSLNLESVSDAELKGMSGGMGVDELQMNDANNSSSTSNNTISGQVTTGTISDSNVSNMSGFNTILLNTGNNVTMQSVTQVNIILK